MQMSGKRAIVRVYKEFFKCIQEAYIKMIDPIKTVKILEKILQKGKYTFVNKLI